MAKHILKDIHILKLNILGCDTLLIDYCLIISFVADVSFTEQRKGEREIQRERGTRYIHLT